MANSKQSKRAARKSACYNELRGQVAYYLSVHGYTKEEFAEMLGMCPASFYNKLKNPDTFKLNEFILLLEFLNLDASTKLKLIA